MASTLLRFRIAPPLYELNRAAITVPARKFGENVDVTIRFNIVPSGKSNLMVRGNVKVIGDDIGTLHNTKVEVEFPRAVDLGMPTPGRFNEGQQTSIQLLNIVIGHYRRVMQLPQIRPVPVKHAALYEYVVADDSGHRQVGQTLVGLGLSPEGDDAGLADGDPQIVTKVQEGVAMGALPIWYSLYLDGLAERAANNYRAALAHLYMSFEMLATTTCRVLGAVTVGEDTTKAFLEPSEEDGQPPSVYSVVKQARDWYGNGPSKTRLTRETKALWKHRNDVMHGRDFPLNGAHVDDVLAAFEVLGPWLTSIGNDLATRTDLTSEERPLS